MGDTVAVEEWHSQLNVEFVLSKCGMLSTRRQNAWSSPMQD